MPTTGNDPLVVDTTELAIILKEYLDRHDRRHPTAFVKHRGVEHSGINHLSDESGISTRAIRRILRCETNFTTLDVTDSLLTAMEEVYRLHNGDLEVVPNPRLTPERVAALLAA
jgi:hypothetical protein